MLKRFVCWPAINAQFLNDFLILTLYIGLKIKTVDMKLTYFIKWYLLCHTYHSHFSYNSDVECWNQEMHFQDFFCCKNRNVNIACISLKLFDRYLSSTCNIKTKHWMLSELNNDFCIIWIYINPISVLLISHSYSILSHKTFQNLISRCIIQ